MTHAENIVTAARSMRCGLAFEQLVEMGGSIEYSNGKWSVCAAVPELDEAGISSFYRSVPTLRTTNNTARELVRVIGEVHAAWTKQQKDEGQ